MSNLKTFKKGELILKEGDKIAGLVVIQTGKAQAFLARPKQNIELFDVLPNHAVGEQVLMGVQQSPYSVVAVAETKVLEIPLDLLKTQLDTSSQIMKSVIKGLSERLKTAWSDIRSMKMEKDNSPCPPEQTAKIFGVIWHVATLKGQKKEKGPLTVEWTAFKQYAQRIFLESPKRLEQACQLLTKLKLAQMQMIKNEDDPDEPEQLGFVHFSDLQVVQDFFEFYQFYYFKGGKQDLLKTDDTVMAITAALVKCAAGAVPDRLGSVRLDYAQLTEKFKEHYGAPLKSDYFSLLENKGLFVKRNSTDDGVFLQFELKEFTKTQQVWNILREVEKWNLKGFVDMNEEVEQKKKANGNACPACQTELQAAAKFCSNCGHKIAAAA